MRGKGMSYRNCYLPLAVAILIAAGPPAPFARGQCEDYQLVPSSRGNGYDFGASLAVDENVLAIGASSYDFGRTETGGVHVFRAQDGGWVEEALLLPSDGSFQDRFGITVDVLGDVIAVGAHWKDHEDDIHVGAAYIFRYDGRRWIEEQKLMSSEPVQHAKFGGQLVLHDDMLIIAARHDRNRVPGESGSVYVFRHDGQRWVEWQKIVEPNVEGYGESFGWTLGVSGDWMAVSGYGDDMPKVHLFEFDGITWEHRQTVSDPIVGQYNSFGTGVAIDAGTLVAGDPADRLDGRNGGAVYVYRLVNGIWQFAQTLTPAGLDHYSNFGTGISVMNKRMVVHENHGGECVYEFDGNAWLQTHRLVPSDDEWVQQLGGGLDQDPDHCYAGAFSAKINGIGSGAALSYPVSGDRCTGRERLAAWCKAKRSNKVKIVTNLKRARPMATLHLNLDNEPDAFEAVNVNCAGEVRRAVTHRVPPGDHQLVLVECAVAVEIECN